MPRVRGNLSIRGAQEQSRKLLKTDVGKLDRKTIRRKKRIAELIEERAHKEAFYPEADEESITIPGEGVVKRLKIKRVNVPDDFDFPRVDERLPQHPFRLGLVAPSGSGKTTTIINFIGRKDFLKNYFDEIHIFSPSLFSDPSWDPIIPLIDESMLHTEVDWDEISAVVEQQENRLDKAKNKLDIPMVLIIIDDPVGRNLFSHSAYEGPLEHLLTTGRQLSISLMLATQKYNVWGPVIRKNFSHLLGIGNLISNEEWGLIGEDNKGPSTRKEFETYVNKYVDGKYAPFFIKKNESDPNKRFRPGLV